jgi:competence protein ComEC
MGPIPLIAVSFAIGIAAGLHLPVPAWSAIAVVAGIGIALPAAVASRRMLALSAIVAALALGWARAPLSEDRPAATPPAVSCPRLFEGLVVTAPARLDGRSRAIIELTGCSPCLEGVQKPILHPAVGTMFLTVMGDERPSVARGDRVRTIAPGRPLANHHNPPGLDARPPQARWTAVIDRADALVRLESGSRALRATFDLLRADLADFWIHAIGEERARLARALTLGEASVLDPGQKERFRRTGTAHLLAVSGMHLGLVALGAFALLRRLLVRVIPLSRRIDVARVAAAAAIPCAIGFALLAGGRPPVVRACVMAVCVLAGTALGRKAHAPAAVATAGIALLAFDPSEMLRPGFQLSFSAVLGFLFVLRRAEAGTGEPLAAPEKPARIARIVRRVGRGVARLLRASAAATAVTTPLVLFHFDRVSLVGLPVNAVAVPIAIFAVMPGLLLVTLLATPLPSLAAALAHPVGWLLGALDRALGWIAGLPCTLESPGPLAAAATLMLCLGLLLALARRYRVALAAGALAALVLAASLVADPSRFPERRLTLDFLDVGQGDATLVTFPDGRHWLVDAGGSHHGAFDVGEHLLLPILRALRVRRLDKLVLTHPDPDHVGGMPAVVAALPVKQIWDNGQGKAEGAVDAYAELLGIAARRGIPVRRTPGICGPHRVGEVAVAVLHPCHDELGYDPGLSFNDNSLVLRISYGRVSALLPGDLSADGEQLLLERGALQPTDLLKLGHHGSRTSTTPALLDALGPGTAVASCGAWNRFGMPHRSLRHALARRGLRLLSTDAHGAVRASTGGRTIEIATLAPR